MPRKKRVGSEVEAEVVEALNRATDQVMGREAVTFGPNDAVFQKHPDGTVEDLRPLANLIGAPPIVVLEPVTVGDEDDGAPDAAADTYSAVPTAHNHLAALRAYLDAAATHHDDGAVPEWDGLAREDRDRIIRYNQRWAEASEGAAEGFNLNPDGYAPPTFADVIVNAAAKRMEDIAADLAATPTRMAPAWCRAYPEAALAVYQAIVTGKVKIATWKGRALVSATGETVGSVLITPLGYGARFGRSERDDDGPEDVCRAWVEAAAVTDGWAVLP